jgi:putative flippase GtrA
MQPDAPSASPTAAPSQNEAPKEPASAGFKRFMKSSLVGIVATIVDVTVLLVCLRVFALNPYLAKVIALAGGVTTQFLGNRRFAFQASTGRLRRQLQWFAVVEAIAFVTTVFVFRGLLALGRHFDLPLADLGANLLSGSIVYFGFSYPLWKRVFALTPEERALAEAERAKSATSTPSEPT